MRKPRVVGKSVAYSTKNLAVEFFDIDLGSRKKKIPVAIYPDAVAIIPLLDDKTVVLAKEYRPTVNKTFWSIPGGKIDGHGDSDMASAAKRELLEEVGYSCKSIKKIFTYYPIVGLTTARVHIFLAKGLVQEKQHLDEDECIIPVKVNIKDIPKLIKEGKIADSKSIIGLTMLHSGKW